ncbi:MAG: bifunctional UDP-N-acetylglucosamine diphosphorylase/glucosamine-1-phosphate N-acetyltransferase GlmU, partial [Ktedonobacteraceae bacterium]|nr:bifunctional UDP-N-acetylglucosamine diphosphorylase/glucosamine-1-phosphate N-acetyltransferase GlmU [Ktedonobacteraceae bacterium]
KNHTAIGAHAFIGSDTLLVAPVTVGERAHTGDGAVVRDDVAPGALVVGVPARFVRMFEPLEHASAEGNKKE